jgi:hypothetical protein
MPKIMNDDEYKQKFYNKWRSTKVLLSEYHGSTKPVLVKCLHCGNQYEKVASEALRYGCIYCARRKSLDNLRSREKQSANGFIDKLREKFNGKYTLIGEYSGMKVPALFKCNECNREFMMRPDDLFYNGRSCNCEYWKRIEEAKVKKKLRLKKRTERESRLWNNDKFLRKVNEIWGDEFEVLSEFKALHRKVLVKHKICGLTYQKRAVSLIQGHGCLYCSRAGESTGVRLVRRVLDDLKLNYWREFKFEDCKCKNPLLFDFAVYDKNNNLMFLIEWDGEQHFRPKQRTGGVERLRLIQKRDSIKNEYCKQNGLKLLRLKYTLLRQNNAYERIKNKIIKFMETAN